jgi:hypothetical protein
MRLRNITVGLALCAAMFVAAPAYGQSAAQNGYSQPAGSVQQQLGGDGSDAHSATTEPTASKSSGTLPFTGLDIALVVAAGGVLVAMGMGIRRLSRSSELA